MEEKFFETETDTKLVMQTLYRSVAIIFAVCSALCCFAFLISWQAFLFFEIIALISCLITALRKPKDCSLRFEGDRLYITDKKSGESFTVFDVPADDFIIKQTKSEMKSNHCSLVIKNTVFMLGGVKNCSEMKEYIVQNFK